MKITPVYIKSLELRNLRTFPGKAVLDFERPDGTLPQWTLILGDNSIGKTTLLQCVAWMIPLLPSNDTAGQVLKKKDIEPIINNEENETLERLVHKGTNVEKDFSFVRGNFVAGHGLPGKKLPKNAPFCYSEMKIFLKSNLKLKDVKHKFDTNAEHIFLKNKIYIFCYSASRTIGKSKINDQYVEEPIRNFLTDATILYDAEEILHTVNYAALGAKGDEKAKYENYIDKVKSALVSILPDIDKIQDIEITTPKLNNGILESGEVFITTRHGKNIPFKDFSLGYKSVMSWVVDLSWRLFNEYSLSKKPLEEPAIVIVDEVDLHLHPVWQRQLISNLSSHFPNIQFIATAHSPLMVQAALDQNYAVLKYDNDGVEIINQPQGIDGWRVDQILTSDFFGLKTARGIEYERLMLQRENLLRKRTLTKQEKETLENLTSQLSNSPTGETPEEIENRKLVSEVVSKIKEKKIIVKI